MYELFISPALQKLVDEAYENRNKILLYIKRKFYKGRISAPDLSEFEDYDYRLKTNPVPKAKIAKSAVFKILPSINKDLKYSVMLDSGSVTYNIANQIFSYRCGNIITNNYAIAMLYHNLNHSVPNTCRLLPGEMLRSVCAQGGEEVAKAAYKELKYGSNGQPPTETAILGLRAYSPKKGLTEDTPELTKFQATLLEYSKNLIIVAQGEKFLKKANAPILNSKKFLEIMEKRRHEKSLWFIYHTPNAVLSHEQEYYYKKNLEEFLRLLPEDRVYKADKEKIEDNMLVVDEIYKGK